MSNKNLFDNFTKQYKLSKTLRFELIPVGDTKKIIEEKGFLQKDEQRAEDYKIAKKLIDEYHKDFIEKTLSDKELPSEKLNEYLEEFLKPKKDIKKINKICKDLREGIAKWFKENPTNEVKKLIEEKVPDFLKNQDRYGERELILKFKGFTTYFKGFNENRKNIYSDKEQSTAIAYRIVNENLPKFINNMIIYQKLKSQIDFSQVEINLREELNGNKLEEVFIIDYFSKCLTQSQIDKYNAIIGGKTDKDGNKVQGLNEMINLFRQKNNLKRKDAPLLSPLYKQILSDITTVSFLPEQFGSAEELIKSIGEFYEGIIKDYTKNNERRNLIDEIECLFKQKLNSEDCDISQIYIKNRFISAISQQIFGDYSLITDSLRYFLGKVKKVSKKLEAEAERYMSKNYFSISEIEKALKTYLEENDVEISESRKEFIRQENILVKYFNLLGANIGITKDDKENPNIIDNFRSKHKDVQKILSRTYNNNNDLIQDKEAVLSIKEYLDSYVNILNFMKPLFVNPPSQNETELPSKDFVFYSEFDVMFNQLSSVISLYNKVRNFLTQKPNYQEKFKLNFENVTLLDGWDVNKEPDNTAVILREDNSYYLGIMDKKHNKIFETIPDCKSENGFYEKMVYKLLPGANKMLPKVIFSEKRIKDFNPPDELYENYKKGTHKKGDNFSKEDCHRLIDFFKSCIAKHTDWNQFNFQFSPTSNYEDINDFYKEVEQQGYKISFKKVPVEYINQLVSDGKLYLFKIYNKDFSPYSKGRPNLHTLYWKELFTETNLNNVVYKLNGEAEVFYRKRIINNGNTIHKKGEEIRNKNPLNPKKVSKFDYDIVKDRRYTENKFYFHVPITLNFKCEDVKNLNEKINKILKTTQEAYILGIDRGERHLVYFSLINAKGEIVKQGSFNVIQNQYKDVEFKTDYHAYLTERERERDNARKSWDTIGKIKDLKEGYISQVVHKIAKMMIEHNAIVIFEDLNFGFKRGRMKVERQVYQKLEKMLIDKLNYLVFKDRKVNEPGGVLNAYQLSAPFKSFREMGKQTGAIFYVPAANTSRIDFATGFVNLLYPRYENEKQAKEFFSKMESISFNTDRDYFEFKVNYEKFRLNSNESLKKNEWTICSYGDERYYYNPSDKKNTKINVTENIKSLFEKHNINYKRNEDIKNDIIAIENAQFFKDLIFYLKLLLQLRYKDNNGNDYILSPVANKDGVFFDSRKARENEPKDGDANGAYHIALKGLLLLKKIKDGDTKLTIRNKEWYDFVQMRE